MGDALAEQAMIAFHTRFAGAEDQIQTKISLFQTLQDIRGDQPFLPDANLSRAQKRASTLLAKLPARSRDALLLRSFENFSDIEIAQILRLAVEDVAPLIDSARADIAVAIAGKILVIEDEPSTAAEIESIVAAMGHSVIGSAPTHADALQMAQSETPDLILSDVQLADGGSGIEAVAELLNAEPTTPVIFVTGFAERLLTGQGPEPTFLISKPFSEDEIRSAVSQAMFFTERTR